MMYVHLCVSTYYIYILLQKKLPSNALATGLAEGGQALGQESLLGYVMVMLSITLSVLLLHMIHIYGLKVTSGHLASMLQHNYRLVVTT